MDNRARAYAEAGAPPSVSCAAAPFIRPYNDRIESGQAVAPVVASRERLLKEGLVIARGIRGGVAGALVRAADGGDADCSRLATAAAGALARDAAAVRRLGACEQRLHCARGDR